MDIGGIKKGGNWEEWGMYVLKELERLNSMYERIDNKISEQHEKLKSEITNLYRTYPDLTDYVQIKTEVDGHAKEINNIRIKFAKWTGGVAVILVILNIIVQFAMSYFTAFKQKDQGSSHKVVTTTGGK